MARSAAYEACERLARAHYENFPVASRLLPATARPHVAAVYAFARVADDFADEGSIAPGERLALLDDWQARLRAAVTPGAHPPATREVRVKDHVIDAGLTFEAVAETIRTCELPVSLFEDLLSAFKQDVTVRRYAAWTDVDDYCRRSANPVGRIVLRIAGYRDGSLDSLVRRPLYGASVDEFLAGPGGRLGEGTSLRAPAGARCRWRAGRGSRSPADDAGMAGRTEPLHRGDS